MKTRDVALGSVYAMSSRLVLMASGFVLQIVLARLLGPELFGLYALIISILLWAEYSVTMGIPSVFQKVVSETRESIRPLIGAVGRYSVPYCLAITILFVLCIPLVARLLGDERLGVLLLIASIDIPVFGLYTTFICMLNGHGQFLLQSMLAATYSIVRTIAIVAAVLVGFGLSGALLGNAAGSSVGVLLTFMFTWRLSRMYRPPDPGKRSALYREVRPRLVSFGLPFALYHLFNSVLIHMDIWFVKALSGNDGPSAEALGYYGVAYNLARIPFFIVSGVSFTAFPAVSKAYFENRLGDVRNLITSMLRMVFIVLLPLNALVFSTAEEMVTFLFSDAYAPAADAFRLLFAGISLYTVFMFMVSTIAARNRPITSMLVSLSLVPVAVALNLWLIPKLGILGAAAATTSVAGFGVLVTWPFLHRQFGNFVDVVSLGKVSALSLVVYFVSRVEAIYDLHLVAGYFALGALYVAGLFLLREVDLGMLRGSVSRR